MRNAQVQILSAVNTGNANGTPTDVNQVVSASFQVIMGDATAEGAVKLQASNQSVANNNRATFVPTVWSDIPNATTTLAAGVGPMIVVPNMAFSYIRAVWTNTTPGSTTISVMMNSLSI